LDGSLEPVLVRAAQARRDQEPARFVSSCIKALGLSPAIMKTADTSTEWSLILADQGTLRVVLSAEETIGAELALVALPRRLQVPMLRHVLTLNRRLRATRIVLRGDRVCLRHDSRFDHITAAEFCQALDELGRIGPQIAHHLGDRFAARLIGLESSIGDQTQASEPTADLVAQARQLEANATMLCNQIEQCLSTIKPLTFKHGYTAICVLYLRAFVIDLHLDGGFPDVSSRLLHHGAGLLEPLWPSNEERGWLRTLNRRGTPMSHASAMVMPMIALLERTLADRGRVQPQPRRGLKPFTSVRQIKGQAEGVVRNLSVELPEEVRRCVALGTVRELLERGRLPTTIRARLADAMEKADVENAVTVLRGVSG
jgi:hypothetical protein